jgi:NAD+ synthase (glutamine-hydrolysing)
MKICISQLNYHIGNFESNLKKMMKSVEEAKNQNADIICFAELATCGYPPRDFLEFDDFIRLSNESLKHLQEMSQNIAIIVGSPSKNPSVEGKDLYNSVYFFYNGEIQFVQHKTLLPTYDVFDEYRYFEPAHNFGVVSYKGKNIALTVCEDIWNIGNENPLYTVCPMDEMMPYKPDLMINVSASPFSFSHAEERLHILRCNAQRYNVPIFYVNQVGAQTELIFDGGSVVVSPDGNIFQEMSYFIEENKVFDLESVVKGGVKNEQPKDKIKDIHDALILGLKDYFNKLSFTKAVLGLSGGIDSAVTLVLAVRSLGKDNVRVLMMPSQFSSQHSIDDAVVLAEKLGIHYDVIPIKEMYDSFMASLKPIFKDAPFNVTEENIQARIRGILNMAISNKFGNILLNTTNKSEMAVGYGTLYGDLCGGLSVIGDVYKTDVYKLADFINKDEILIPENTINKPPSAELRPNQKDSDSLPEYDILDPILYKYIEECKGPDEIIREGFEESLVKRILRLVNINEFKRHQTAPVLRVTSKAFGVGRRMPIVGKYLS